MSKEEEKKIYHNPLFVICYSFSAPSGEMRIGFWNVCCIKNIFTILRSNWINKVIIFHIFQEMPIKHRMCQDDTALVPLAKLRKIKMSGVHKKSSDFPILFSFIYDYY